MLDARGAALQLAELLGRGNVRAIFRVGLTDESRLSDVDLVAVLKSASPKQPPPLDGVDLRAVFTEAQWREQAPLLPYAEFQQLFGEPLAVPDAGVPPHDAQLVKLAAMFGYAFQRGYYDLLARDGFEAALALNRLNDFEYVSRFAPELAPRVSALAADVRAARAAFPNVTTDALRSLLTRGVGAAWDLTGALAEKLHDLLPPPAAAEAFFGREPSVFSARSAAECKLQTEQLGPFAARAKVCVLPVEFSFIAGRRARGNPFSDFAARYAAANCSPAPSAGPKSFAKRLVLAAAVRHVARARGTVHGYGKPRYYINSFRFQYDLFSRRLGNRYDFFFSPPYFTERLSAWKYILLNVRQLMRERWRGEWAAFDVVHLNRPEAAPIFKRRRENQTVVVEIHGFDVGLMGRYYLKDIHNPVKVALGYLATWLAEPFVRRSIRTKADLIYVSTPDLVEPFSAWLGRKVEWLPNPIDADTFTPQGPVKKLSGQPSILLASRLHGDKKPEVAFDIFKNVILPKYPNAVMHLLSTGELVEKYRAETAGDKRFEWLPYMDKPTLVSVIRGADLVFGDFSIGALSMLPLQVMFSGRPIVTLDRYEVVKKDLDELGELALKLLSDAAFRDNYIKKTGEHARNFHSPESVARIHQENLERVRK